MAVQDVFLASSILLALISIGIFFVLLFFVAIYVYMSLAWVAIAKKLKYKKSWLAWIPIANWAMILQLGNFDWKWIFLILVPILGWIPLYVLIIISHWRIFEKAKYPGWLSLSMIMPYVGGILYLIVIGIVAWYKQK